MSARPTPPRAAAKLARLACLATLALACAVGPAAAAAAMLYVVTETTPHSYVRDGRVVGQATEVVETVLKRAGVTDYRIDLYPWARAHDLALREANVLLYMVARTPERENRFKWVGEIHREPYFLYTLAGRTDIRVDRLDDARALTIGVVRDDVRQQYLQRRGFTRLVVSAQPMENLRKLLNRQVDLVPLTDGQARMLCTDAGSDCAGLQRLLPLDELRIGLYMALSLATPDELAGRLRSAFDAVRADGTLARLMGGAGKRAGN